jgi:hypothetical protein
MPKISLYRKNIHPMKKTAFILFNLLLSALLAHAGNMFGPGPFRNGSPLLSGIDGIYQSTARGNNFTGIFRFTYSGGSQTQNTNQNSWIFFVNGQILKGDVNAALEGTNLTGILDAGTVPLRSSSGETDVFPIIFVNSESNGIGTFQGKINLKSPSGEFSGSGTLVGASTATTIFDMITIDPRTNFPWSQQVTVDGQASNLPETSFKFRGVRTSISSTSTNSTAAN